MFELENSRFAIHFEEKFDEALEECGYPKFNSVKQWEYVFF